MFEERTYQQDEQNCTIGSFLYSPDIVMMMESMWTKQAVM
jgi:hypothetical protein